MSQTSKHESERGRKLLSRGRKLKAEEIFQGQKMVIIRHAGEDYRLMVTRNNRLILQK